MNQNCLPEETLCKNCTYCMTRVIEPLDYEAYGLDEEENGNNIIVQALCIISDVDLHDHIVKECNKFKYNIIMKNEFLK